MRTEPEVFKVRIVNVRHRQHNRAYEDDEASGLFHFRHDLLEQLPVYLTLIKKMASSDPDSYAIYSKVGGLLLPPTAMLGTRLDDVDVTAIPSFACAMLAPGLEEEKKTHDIIWPRLIYLQKLKKVPGVQFSDGDIYSMTMFYARADDRHNGVPVRYHVAVSRNGEVRLLRELSSTQVRMKAKRGSHRSYDIPLRHWQVPPILKSVAAEGGKDVNEMAKMVFCFLAGIAPRMHAGIQIRAHRNGPRAVFNVPVGRTPYFFNDREITTNERGRTKKIFHYVPGYARMDGVFVRPHTKGLREFTWNGYQVHVGIPGVDFPKIENFRAAAIHVDDDAPTPAGMMDSAEAAGQLATAVETSDWWRNRKNRRSR